MLQTNQPSPSDLAKLLQFKFPEECGPGIEANLELLQHHMRIVDRYMTRLNTSALATKAPE